MPTEKQIDLVGVATTSAHGTLSPRTAALMNFDQPLLPQKDVMGVTE